MNIFFIWNSSLNNKDYNPFIYYKYFIVRLNAFETLWRILYLFYEILFYFMISFLKSEIIELLDKQHNNVLANIGKIETLTQNLKSLIEGFGLFFFIYYIFLCTSLILMYANFYSKNLSINQTILECISFLMECYWAKIWLPGRYQWLAALFH